MQSQSIDTIASLVKALEAGSYDVAPSKLLQGPALQIEDLSSAIEITTYQDKHIKLQNAIRVESCKSTLAQFDRQLSYGNFGGSAQLEGNVGREETSDYVRVTYPMCYYSKTRRVTLPSMLVQTVDGQKSDERAAKDAALLLAGDVEFDLFRGKADFSNAGVFDGNMGAIAKMPNMLGVDPQIRQTDIMRNTHDIMFDEYGSDESVIIPGGSTLNQDMIQDAVTRSAMNHGSADKLFIDPLVAGNYTKITYAKERVVLAGAPQTATGSDLRRQWVVNGGPVDLEVSRFLSGKTQPQDARPNGPSIPTVSSIATASISGAVTGFLNGEVYKYTVTAGSENGESPRSSTQTVTIDADGKAVQLVISHSGLSNVRYFNVYRSVAGASRMKFIGRVALNVGGSTTTFTDLGNKLPGFVTGFLLDTDTLVVKELAPFSRLKLAVTELSTPEAFFRFLTLGATAPRMNVLIDSLQ